MKIAYVLMIITSMLGIATVIGGWRTGLIGNRNRKDNRS